MTLRHSPAIEVTITTPHSYHVDAATLFTALSQLLKNQTVNGSASVRFTADENGCSATLISGGYAERFHTSRLIAVDTPLESA